MVSKLYSNYKMHDIINHIVNLGVFKMEKKYVGIKLQTVKIHWNKVGLFTTQGWTGIGIDMHKARHA